MNADKDKIIESSLFSHLRLSTFICGCIFCFMLCGCANHKNAAIIDRAVQDYFSGDYPSAAKEIDPLAKKTDEDFVVNNLRLGSIELPPYNLDEAEAVFLRAIEVINSTGVN